MKRLTLIEAIMSIQNLRQQSFETEQVTAIQFEDGSGLKFNYQIDHGPWEFIDLTDKPKLIIFDNIPCLVER